MMTPPLSSTSDRLGMMLFVAACLHLLLILGLKFEFEDESKPEFRQQSLDVMVVQRPKERLRPDETPDYLAQTSQSGGGNQERKAKPTIRPTPPAQQPAPVAPHKTSVAPTPPPPSRQVLAKAKSENKTPAETIKPKEQPPVKPSAAQLFTSRDQEIAYLTAELEKKTRAYAKLPKRKSISASTKEYKYASYLDAWRRKVERIGNLNYPDEAKRQKLYGNLILHVAVKSDGSIEQVRVLRSSGHKLLDDAAVRIVRLAAPYSPFPQEINKETDILDITRTWQFTRSNQLGSR